MPKTCGQHKAGRLPVAYVDKARKTERWAELCEEFAQSARAQGDSEEGADLAAVLGAVIQLMMDFTGAELDPVPRSWAATYLGDDWLEACLPLGGQP